MSEIELRDAILRHALQLQRLSAGHEAEAEAILRELERELRALLNSNVLSEAGKAEIKALIADADKAIASSYGRIKGVVDTHGLAVVVAERTVETLDDFFPIGIFAPTKETLAALTKDVLIDGAPSSAWWNVQREQLQFKFAAEIRQGVINGETNERIVRRIVGGKGEPGIMDTSRRSARALVHSSVMAAANDARLAAFRKNARLIAGVRWLSTLDSHTCRTCAALDGQAWNLEGEPLKGTTVEFDAPPKHFSCRCVLSPIPKTFREIGFDIDEPAPGTRASSEGPISATTSFQDFLKRQSPAFIAKTLGKKRADAFLAGKLSLRDLINGYGRELTLEELGLV